MTKQKNNNGDRGSGVLLHITSLPSEYGIGDLGPGAFGFIDFLHEAKQKYWQILPINPTDAISSHSPYSCISVYAGNTLLISPEQLKKDGWLKQKDFEKQPTFFKYKADYLKAKIYKETLLERCYKTLKSQSKLQKALAKFSDQQRSWLKDYCLFVVLKRHFDAQSWDKWPEEFRQRSPKALARAAKEFHEEIERVALSQYLFFTQWKTIKDYANDKDVFIIGDVPIYAQHDSVDVWVNQDLFKLDDSGVPVSVAGVPPDYFSKTGQRWGNPVYNWKKLKATKFSWWVKRMKHNLEMFDLVRIDHFRGFVQCWEIPYHERTAINGQWEDVPSEEFFNILLKNVPRDSIIAEDLGMITPDVTDCMEAHGFPGMKVLLFAFDGNMSQHPYIPENYKDNCIVYTGTHDNNTARGWFEGEATERARGNMLDYIGKEVKPKDVPWELIQVAMHSRAKMAIFPMQDILKLGSKARMNTPATIEGNWQWRMKPKALSQALIVRLGALTEKSHRYVVNNN